MKQTPKNDNKEKVLNEIKQYKNKCQFYCKEDN